MIKKGLLQKSEGNYSEHIVQGIFGWIFGAFPLEKNVQEEKNPTKNPQQNSNQNLGASRPRICPCQMITAINLEKRIQYFLRL